MLTRFPQMSELKITEKLIFRTIHRRGPLAKRDLVALLGGSVTTISRFLSAMEENGLVMRAAEDRRPGGRRPDIYSVRPDSMHAFGAFITSDGFGIGLCDALGNLLTSKSDALTPGMEPTTVADRMRRWIEEILETTGLKREQVLGLGVGVIGPVRKQKGLMFQPFHMESELWDIVPIRDIVEMKTGFPTFIDSLSETILLNEIIYGHAKGSESAAFIWIDKGIGCAMYTKGILGTGNADLSSSVGHLVIDFKGEECRCGKRGCLETYGSIESLLKRFATNNPELESELAAASTSPLNNDFWTRLPAIEKLQEYLAEEKISRLLVSEIADAFAIGFSNFLSITRPQTVIYGGRTVESMPSLMDAILNKVSAILRDDTVTDMHSHLCKLNDGLVIRGGSLLCLNNYVGFVNTESQQKGIMSL